MKKKVFSFMAFLLLLLFSGAADGLMDALGPARFFAAGVSILFTSSMLFLAVNEK